MMQISFRDSDIESVTSTCSDLPTFQKPVRRRHTVHRLSRWVSKRVTKANYVRLEPECACDEDPNPYEYLSGLRKAHSTSVMNREFQGGDLSGTTTVESPDPQRTISVPVERPASPALSVVSSNPSKTRDAVSYPLYICGRRSPSPPPSSHSFPALWSLPPLPPSRGSSRAPSVVFEEDEEGQENAEGAKVEEKKERNKKDLRILSTSAPASTSALDRCFPLSPIFAANIKPPVHLCVFANDDHQDYHPPPSRSLSRKLKRMISIKVLTEQGKGETITPRVMTKR